MGLIFFGTPEFAVPSLNSLLDSGEKVSLVVTQTDKLKRDGTPLPIPVKEEATKRGIEVLQPERLKDSSFIETLKTHMPEFIIVVAYGRILPCEILTLPERSCINVHASLLPKFRGAAPIQWAIIKGERITGITTMLMDEGLDTGDILLQKEIEIKDEDNAITLSRKLSEEGARLLVETIRKIRSSEIKPVPQRGEPSYAPPLKKEDGLIDWNKPARDIYNLIRGAMPWPWAYTFLNGERIIILKARVLEGSGIPGRIEESRERFIIGTGKGFLEILELKPEGKRSMDSASFLRGRRLHTGLVVGE